MSYHTCFRAVRRLFAATSLIALPAAPVAAQDTAVVFVHGILSDGTVWDFAAGSLRQQLQIEPVQPSISWWLSEATQASELTSYLNSHSATSDSARRMPFVARSNGGLASREYVRTGGRTSYIATVATPHQGAQLANNWLNYGVPVYALSLLDALYLPLDFYYSYDPEAPWLVDVAANAMGPLVWLASNLDGLMCPVAGMCLVWDGFNNVAVPAAHDMATGSAAIALLNSGSNLSQEAAALGARVGLWTEANPYGALFALFSESPSSWITARDVAYMAYIAGYQYYRDSWDPFLSAYAGLWIGGAAALIDIDANWQGLIGTLDSYYRVIDGNSGNWYTLIDARPNDGVVPAASGAYPGGTRNAQISGNLVHTRQAESPAVVSALHDALYVDFAIPKRTTTPPPPSYSAQVQGPQAIRPWSSCYWYASTNVPDPSYEWWVDGIPVAGGQDIFYSTASSFTLTIQVWNSSGAVASGSLYVDVDPTNGECAIS